MKTVKGLILLLLTISEISIAQKSTQTESIVNINMDKNIGIIRPLHGGNNGPVSALKVLDFSDFFKECKIPLVRLHDVTWSTTYAVDITTIFRDFRDDPSMADNYDFRQTDDYIAAIIKTGAGIVYRLGESIEWTKRKYNVNPPLDNEKWAAICCGIIRHYNEGWANGFHYNIKYWEIWNEADCRSGNWTGTHEQYFNLYEIAAKTIKNNFPDVKVGGPASCGPVSRKDGVIVASDFVNTFLSFCQKKSVPLDFFTWHKYGGTPWDITSCPACIRDCLNQYGFLKTESHLNEWNYVPEGDMSASIAIGEPRVKYYAEQTSVKGGAFIADVLMLLQDEPVDATNLYTITNGEYGLFSDMGVPHKSSYAFRAFAELVNNTPVRLASQYNKEDSLVICSGTNKEKTVVAILVSNFTSKEKMVDFKLANSVLEGPIKYELYAVDESHNFSIVNNYEIKSNNILQISEKVKGPSVLLLKFVSSKYKKPE
jgi:xylan 1,4-beta-xylosidase